MAECDVISRRNKNKWELPAERKLDTARHNQRVRVISLYLGRIDGQRRMRVRNGHRFSAQFIDIGFYNCFQSPRILNWIWSSRRCSRVLSSFSRSAFFLCRAKDNEVKWRGKLLSLSLYDAVHFKFIFEASRTKSTGAKAMNAGGRFVSGKSSITVHNKHSPMYCIVSQTIETLFLICTLTRTEFDCFFFFRVLAILDTWKRG